MYKLTVTYDSSPVPKGIYSYSDELEAFKNFLAFTDWGMANEYSTVNLSTPTGKMYTKIFYREGRKVVEK
jgi:hypothetical protein